MAFGNRPNLSEGDVLLLDDDRVAEVVDIDYYYDAERSYGYRSVYEYYVTLSFSDDTQERIVYPEWIPLQNKKVFDDNLKVGDVVEINPVGEEAAVELDRNPRGKIVAISEDDLKQPYIVRSLDGGHELPFSRTEFAKVLSATSYEKRGETIQTLDKQIAKMDSKIKSLIEQRDALKVAREVMDYVVT